MNLVLLVALVIAAVSVPAYLVLAQMVAMKLQKSYPDEWDKHGRPSAMQAAHQGALFKVLFGRANLSSDASNAVAEVLFGARVLGVVSLISVIVLFYFSW